MLLNEAVGSVQGQVVCLCIPAEARVQAHQVEAELARRGAIVLGSAPNVEKIRATSVPDALAQSDRLRIEVADRMMVVTADGRVDVDEVCAEQITYALSVGCRVEFLGPTMRMHLDPDLYNMVYRRRKTVEVRLADARRAALAPGTLIVFVRRDGAENELLCRVTMVERFGHRAGLLAMVDPSAVLPGSNRSGLAARLEEIYPESVGHEHLAIHVQCLGEADPARERDNAAHRAHAPARHGAGVLIVNQDSEVLLVPARGERDCALRPHHPGPGR